MSVQKKSLITQRNSVKKAAMAKPQTSSSIKPGVRSTIQPKVNTAVSTKVSASET